MKKTQDNKVGPEVSEPTEEEIGQTKEMFDKKYDIVIPKADAKKLAKLIKELNWWLKVGKGPSSPSRVTEEMALEFKDLVKKVRGTEITLAEAYEEAHSLFVILPVKEKMRVSDEMRAIIVTHREVERNSIVEEKAAKLLKLHYDIELADDQLGQVVYYLTKQLWFKEGLDESLEKCLDDLLVYADKRKRGKRVNGLDLHNGTRKVIDWVMNELKIAGKGIAPLYQEREE